MTPVDSTEPAPDEDKAPEVITFEDGYEELKAIVARLGADDVSIDDLLGGFRRGRGLALALRTYLTEREGELTEIEQGDNLPQFNVVSPSAGPAQES